MNIINHSVTEFTELLASPAPVPGGGGASALVASIAAALGDMVGELTVGKKKFADVEPQLRALMARAQDLRFRLLQCVEKDAEAFEPLSRAYAIPKDDPSRDAVMERCLRTAAEAPLEIFDLCCKVIELQQEFAEKGSRLVASDAATGAALCAGALYGAAVNVKVNTKLMRDRSYAEAINAHIDEDLDRYRALAGEIFNSGKRSETDPNLWLGNEVTRNVTTYIGEEVELVMVFNFKVPDYNFLHLSYYTFNTNEEVTEDNFIQKYALPAEIEGVPTPYDAPIWWTQVNPSYFTTVKEKGTPEAEAQTRVSNRYALADYDVAYINLSELAFNVVDDKDDIIEAEDLEKLGLVAKFVYTDKALEADDAELPKPDKDACDNEFLLYKSLWVDNTTFYYLTNEHPFIPALGTLTLNVGEEGKGGYAFPVATRFEFPKEAVKHAGVNLDYSSYAMVRWTPFKAPKANGFTIVLDENKVYAEPLFKGMELKDNRPNNTSFFVIQDGEWVVGNAAENATKSSTTNGYMKGVNAKEAYHIKAAFDYSDVELPAELKKLLKVKFSADGKTFVDENDENETLTPYVVFDYTSEVQFRGTITIPVVVRLQNPWQQEIKFAYNFIIKGVE